MSFVFDNVASIECVCVCVGGGGEGGVGHWYDSEAFHGHTLLLSDIN